MSELDIFTGLVPDNNPTWRREVIQLPPMAPGEQVEETLWDIPVPFIHSEDQLVTNSCGGHGGSTAVEAVEFGGTGQMIQLSRWGLYLCAQKRCGLFGRDVGTTLTGLHKALTLDGIGEETFLPFPGVYDTRIPAAYLENAKLRKMTHSIDVESGGYDACRTVIGQNIGAVVMACHWSLQLTNGNEVRNFRPLGRGGHCMAWVALSKRLDERGRPWMIGSNSHRNRPWLLWSPDAVEYVTRNERWGSFGITRMVTPKPRKPHWTGADNPFLQ